MFKYTWNNSERGQCIRVLPVPYIFPITQRPAFDWSVKKWWAMWLHKHVDLIVLIPSIFIKIGRILISIQLKEQKRHFKMKSTPGGFSQLTACVRTNMNSPLRALSPQRSWSGWVYAEVRSWLGWRERPERLRSTSPPTAGRYTTTEWWWTCSYAMSSPVWETNHA